MDSGQYLGMANSFGFFLVGGNSMIIFQIFLIHTWFYVAEPIEGEVYKILRKERN
jgi:hypothetical protein